MSDTLWTLLLGSSGILSAIIAYVLLERKMRVEADLKRQADDRVQAARKQEVAAVAEQTAQELWAKQGLQRIADLEAEVKDGKTEIAEYKKEGERQRDRIMQLAQDALDRKTERDELKKRVEEFTELLEAKESRIKALEIAEERRVEAICRMEDEIIALKEQIAILTANREKLEGENTRLTAEVDRLRRQLAEREAEVTTLKEEQVKLREELDILKAQTNGHSKDEGEQP